MAKTTAKKPGGIEPPGLLVPAWGSRSDGECSPGDSSSEPPARPLRREGEDDDEDPDATLIMVASKGEGDGH